MEKSNNLDESYIKNLKSKVWELLKKGEVEKQIKYFLLNLIFMR